MGYKGGLLISREGPQGLGMGKESFGEKNWPQCAGENFLGGREKWCVSILGRHIFEREHGRDFFTRGVNPGDFLMRAQIYI